MQNSWVEKSHCESQSFSLRTAQHIDLAISTQSPAHLPTDYIKNLSADSKWHFLIYHVLIKIESLTFISQRVDSCAAQHNKDVFT